MGTTPLFIDHVTSLKADLPGANLIAGRKPVIEPQAALEDSRMVLLIKINEQITDIAPQALANYREPFNLFYTVPVRKQQLVNHNKGRILVLCSLKYFLKPVL
jgi:hypothetical protein